MPDFLKKLKDNLLLYLRNHSVLFAKNYVSFALAKRAKEKSIIVYSMGKVGSTTVTQTLTQRLKDYSIYHVHWLNKGNLDLDTEFHKKIYRRNREQGIKTSILPSHIIRGYYLQDKIKSAENELKIVTLTRDPVARNMSAFFQKLKKFFCYDITQRLTEVKEDVVVSELIDFFLTKYIDQNRINFIDGDPLTWFDKELRSVFGIDVYQQAFPKEKGYEIYKKGNISTLLIRLENLNACFEESTKEFIGEGIQVKRPQNSVANKEYSTVYSKFKEKIDIPRWYLDKLYDSKYARHFYTDAEISRFRNRWDRQRVTVDSNNQVKQELTFHE